MIWVLVGFFGAALIAGAGAFFAHLGLEPRRRRAEAQHDLVIARDRELRTRCQVERDEHQILRARIKRMAEED